MSPAEVISMPSHKIVELLENLTPSGDAIAWLSAVIADRAIVEGVNELARRYQASAEDGVRRARHESAASVHVDGDRLRHFCWSRRMTLTQLGELAGKCSAFGSVVCNKGRINYWTADTIAAELGLHIDDFLAQIAAPEELERMACV